MIILKYKNYSLILTPMKRREERHKDHLNGSSRTQDMLKILNKRSHMFLIHREFRFRDQNSAPAVYQL